MQEIEIRYRTWYRGWPPQPIKLKIPGWSGCDHNHKSGAIPQPWHCPPFVEGSTYGLELIYPFDCEMKVTTVDGKINFDGDFSSEAPNVGIKWPPFDVFAPGHYGYTSALDIIPPEGHVIRVEPHPRYFTDETWSTPCAVPGHIQGEWWPRIFFVVFKAPGPGQVHVFKKGHPFAQILIVPHKVKYEIYPMDAEEAKERCRLENLIDKYDKYLAENQWVDHIGNAFNDKYKVMSRIYSKDGFQGVKDYIESTAEKVEAGKAEQAKTVSSRMKRIFIPPKNDTLQIKEETKES